MPDAALDQGGASGAPSETFLATYGPAVRANGYSVIGIQPKSKVPLLEHDWQNRCWNIAEPSEIEDIAIRHPDAGLGLACGRHTVAFDIDLEDADAVGVLRSLVEEVCGQTPLIRVGKAPKLALVYRSAEPIVSVRVPWFDMLGLGCQLIGYGVHPGTGRPYDWIGEGAPHRTPVDALPAVTQKQCLEVATRYMEILYGDRFRHISFGVDIELLGIAFASRTTLLKQLATRLFRGRAAAQTRIRQQIREHRLPAGLWGGVMRPEVEGCADHGAILRNMRPAKAIELLRAVA